MTPRAVTLLEDGASRSAIVRNLVHTLEQSDVIVLVDTGSSALPSQLCLAAATASGRIVRIRLRVPEADDILLAWLAHELQHAVEIAGDPSITSTESLLQFYTAHGQRTADNGWCTHEAQRVTSLVQAEVGASASARR